METCQRSTTFKTKNLNQPLRDWIVWKAWKMSSFQSFRSSSLKSAECTTAWIKAISSCYASQTFPKRFFTTHRRLKESSWAWSTAPSLMRCETHWTLSSTSAPSWNPCFTLSEVLLPNSRWSVTFILKKISKRFKRRLAPQSAFSKAVATYFWWTSKTYLVMRRLKPISLTRWLSRLTLRKP